MSTPAARAMQEAAVAIAAHRDALEASILMYGCSVPELAEKARTTAHDTLDAILDAQRAKHEHLTRALRGG
jgi:lambda repressor-like predicted transcriptional regulator